MNKIKTLNKISWNDILGKICTCKYKNNKIVIHNGYITIVKNETYKSSFIFTISFTLKNVKDRIKIACN